MLIRSLTLLARREIHAANGVLHFSAQDAYTAGKYADAKFAIHANCWPRAEGEVRAHMRLASSQIRQLRPIDRDTMVALFRDGGIHGPPAFLFLLLDYCDGKPGLAAALVDLIKRADVDHVWSGNAVLDELIEGPQLAPSQRERAVLAVLSISGDAGQTLKDVASALELSALEVREIVTNLAAGGVIEECGSDRFQVRPTVLRGVLAKDVFFSGPTSLDVRPLLALSVSSDETAHVLMGAKQRDGSVPLDLVEPLVASSRNAEVWKHFAYCCDEWTELILTKYPNRVAAAGRGLLQRFPDEALLALLEGDAGYTSRAGDFRKQREVIASWLMGDDLGDGVTVERRRQLLEAIERARSNNPPLSPETVGWALGEVISPGFSKTEATPGSGRQFSMYSGTWSKDELSAIAALWPRVTAIIRTLPVESWAPVRTEIENWTNPGRVSHFKKVDRPVATLMRATATRMLADVAALPKATPLLHSWVVDKAAWAKLRVSVAVDKDVRLLYGNDRYEGDFDKREARLSAEMQKLAQRLAKRTPADVLEQLEAQENAFRAVAGSRGGRQWRLFSELARAVTSPEGWLSAAVQRDAGEDAISSFAWRLIEVDESAALGWLQTLLAAPRYERIAVNYVLRLPSPPASLLDRALSKFSAKHYDALQLGFLRLPPEVMLRLLTHSEREVRVLAALAEWCAERKGDVRVPLRTDWRRAVLEAEDEDAFHLEAVLRADPELAYEWVDRKIGKLKAAYRVRALVSGAASVIPVERRVELIKRLADAYDDELFSALFRGDMEVFAAWISLPIDDHRKLEPLRAPRWSVVENTRPYHITDRWIAMALCAVDAGISDALVARYARPSMLSVQGDWSKFLEGMMKEYKRLLAHPDRRLHRAGREGLAWAEERRDEALREEEEERIRGI